MPEITQIDLAWNPPPFPAQGRLSTHSLQVGQNCHQQGSDERHIIIRKCAWQLGGVWSRHVVRHCISVCFSTVPVII